MKLLLTLLQTNTKLKPTLCRLHVFEVLGHRMAQQLPTFSYLQTLCDFVVGFVNVQALYPQSNTYVSAIINRSPIASDILRQVGGSQQSGGPSPDSVGLAHPEALELLFVALSRTKELHYRLNMLRLLQNAVAKGTVEQT
jgi:hypothetical protein